MNSYELLGLSSNANNQEIVEAHEKLLRDSASQLKEKPDLLKLRKFSLDKARNALLDPIQRIALDDDLLSDKSRPSGGSTTLKTNKLLRAILYPFRKISTILIDIFGPAFKYLYRWLVRLLRIGLVVVSIWFIGFSSQLETYRDTAFIYANVMFDDIRPMLPNFSIRDYLPAFLGGRYTYNSSACEKIRLKVAAMEVLLEEEEKKSRGIRLLGIGAAIVKLAQGDTDRAKRYGGDAARYASKIEDDVREAKVFLQRVQIDHLECIKKPK